MRSPLVVLSAVALSAGLLAGCADDSDDVAAPLVDASSSASPSTGSGSASTGSASASTGSASASGSASALTADPPGPGVAGYTPVSDVVPHAKIGQDAAKARELMAPATTGGAVDWAAVGEAFRTGGPSVKGDGTIRTLEKLLESHPAIDLVNAAIDGTGDSAGASDAVRRQRVDKGITVILAAKVIEELGRAEAKLRAGELDPVTGAAHNVDEAFAFFQAEDQGPASTAMKRGADFDVDVYAPVLAALTAAQKASLSGNLAGFTLATLKTQDALDHIFYLATFKYLDTEDDEVTRAEGESFYLAIAETVRTASADADAAITAAFAAGDADAGRAALNTAAVVAALGIDEAETQED